MARTDMSRKKDKRENDPLKAVGNVLIAFGVAVWGCYAAARYGLKYNVHGITFLPYHLAGVIPGFILRRHRFFQGLARRITSSGQ
jgi:hypothetical protein